MWASVRFWYRRLNIDVLAPILLHLGVFFAAVLISMLRHQGPSALGLVLDMLTLPALLIFVIGLVAVLTQPEGIIGLIYAIFMSCGLLCATGLLPALTLGSAALLGRWIGRMLVRMSDKPDRADYDQAKPVRKDPVMHRDEPRSGENGQDQ